MKKIMYLLSIGLIVALLGCGTSASTSTPTTAPTVDQKAESQKRIDADNAKLKMEAVKANFIEINGHYDKVKAKPVFAEGKISVVDNTYAVGIPNFLLNQGGGSLFYILNGSDTLDLKDGDMVKVYGRVTDPKEGIGMPTIMCTVVERIPVADLAPAQNGLTMTMSEFTQLKDGMSYEEATKIIGGPGEIMSESGTKGDALHTVMYQYKGEGDLGANANLMFQGNKLKNKAQFGLK